MNEKIKKIRNIGIIILLVIASYTGVFLWGYIRGKAGRLVGSEAIHNANTEAIEQGDRDIKELNDGITEIGETSVNISEQVDIITGGIGSSSNKVRSLERDYTGITDTSGRIRGHSKELEEGLGETSRSVDDIGRQLDKLLK